jgi:hypothetical protein
VNYTDSADSGISSVSRTSIAMTNKRKQSEDEQIHISDRIPKRQRNIKVMPPNVSRSSRFNSYNTINFEEGVYFGPFTSTVAARDKALSYKNPEGPDRNISLKELRIRESYWKEVTSYKPDSRCIPMETYLVIAVTSSGPDDAPYVLKKFKDEDLVVKDKEFKAFLSIKKIILIERPVGGDSMYYCIPNLHKWVHGSLHLKSIQERYFKDATRHIQDIKTIRAGDQYNDKELGIHVRYQDRGPCLRKLLPYIAQEMDPSNSTARQVPCISWGWSTANPHEYKNNRSNMFGSITPFLSDCGLRRLHQSDKDMIVELVCYVINMFSPYGIHPTPFYHSDPNIRKMRDDFALQFLQAVGRASSRVNEKCFLAEGVAFVFNNFVPFHVDQQNDTSHGMNETLAINCLCRISTELSSIPSIRKAMNLFHLNVGDPLSFSLVLYSRKVIGDFIKKQLKLQSILNASNEDSNNNLPDCWWLLKPLIEAFQKVDSEVNSNAIWDDPSLLDKFMDKVQRDHDGNAQYQGDYVLLSPGFDPMRYWSPVKYLFDALQARQIVKWNRHDALGLVCFASLEINGTFLLSSIVDDLLSNSDPINTLFMEEYKKYGLYAALIFAGYRKNKIDNEESGVRYGYSQKGREVYNERGTCERTPIAGETGLLSFSEENKDLLKQRCDDIVRSLLEELEETGRQTYEVATQKRKGTVDNVARFLIARVQRIAGPGISRVYAHNFMQVASMFGFIPFDLLGWTCIDDQTSDAYQMINNCYKNAFGRKVQDDLSVVDADRHFKAAVKYIASNMNWNATAVTVKNTLIDLYRESGALKKDDILFLFPHRNRAVNHLYRWKMDNSGEAMLQVLLIDKDNKIAGKSNLFKSFRGGCGATSTSVKAGFTGGGIIPGVVPHGAKYSMSEDYIRSFDG